MAKTQLTLGLARGDRDGTLLGFQVARRNYEKLVRAAREVFAESGADTPLEDVARHAGVGIATLYRNFPTHAALLETISWKRSRRCAARRMTSSSWSPGRRSPRGCGG